MRRLALTLALLAAPFAAPAQTAQEEQDKGYLTNLIEENLSGVGREVTITGFRGALSAEATLDRLSIADAQGIWLTMEDVTLDWNRSALLRRQIDVEELSAAKISVLRPPVADPDLPKPEAQPFSLPELPVGISLEELRIDRIELGSAFLGQPVAVSLTGNAQLEDGEGSANIVAERIDGGQGRFEIDGSYSNVSEVLSLLVNLDEGPGGIAAKSLGLPGDPAVSLRIEGEAPVSDFTAQIALATNGQERLEGSFEIAAGEDVQRIALDLGGDISPLFDAEYRDFFGEDSRLQAELQLSEDGRIELPRLELSSRRLRLAGTLRIGAEGWPERIDLTGGITGDADEPVLLPLPGPKTYLDDLTIEIDYDAASSDAWTADILARGLDRPGLEIAELSLDGSGRLVQGEGARIGGFTAAVDYGATGVAFDDDGAAEAFGSALTGRLRAERREGALTEITEFTLNGAGIDLALDGTVAGPDNGFEIAAEGALEVAGLDRFSTLAGRELDGAAELALEALTLRPLDGIFDITLAGRTQDLAVGTEQVDPLLSGEGRLRARLVRDTEGTRIEGLDIRTDEAAITADLDLASAGSSGAFSADLRDVALVLPGVRGAAMVSGTVSADEAGVVDFDLSGTAPDARFDAAGQVVPLEEGLRLSIDGQAAVSDLQTYALAADRPLDGAVDLTFKGEYGTARGSFDLALSGSMEDLRLGVPQLDPFLLGEGTINGGIARQTDGTLVLTDLDLTLPELQFRGSARLRGQDAESVEGPLEGDFTLRVADASLLDPALAGPLDLSVQADPLPNGETDVTLSAVGPGASLGVDAALAEVGETYRLSGQVTASVEDLADYRELAQRPIGGSLSLEADGTFLLDLSRVEAKVSVEAQDLALGQELADRLLAGPARLDAQVTRDGEGGVAMRGLRLATPEISANGFVEVAPAGPITADLNARLRDASVLDPSLTGPLTLSLDADPREDGSTELSLAARGPGLSLTAEGDVAPAAQDYEFTGTIGVRAENLDAYEDLVGRDIGGAIAARAQGSLLPDLSRFDLTLSGTTRSLQVGVPVADALLAGPGQISGGIARDGAAAVRLQDFRAETPQFTLRGDARIAPDAPISADLALLIRDARVIDPRLSGPLNLDVDATPGAGEATQLVVRANGPSLTASAEGRLVPEGEVYSFDGTATVRAGDLRAYRAILGRPISGSATVEARGQIRSDLSVIDVQVDGRSSDLALGIPQLDAVLAGAGQFSADVRQDEDGLTVRRLSVRTRELTLGGELDGRAGAGRGRLEAVLRDLGILNDQLSGPLRVAGEANLTPAGNWRVDATGQGPGGLQARVNGIVREGGGLDLSVDGRAPLELLNGVLDPRRLSGNANFALRVVGPPALDSVSGTVTIADARLSAPTLKQSLERIRGTVSLSGGQAQIDLVARFPEGGRMNIDGGLGLGPALPADLQIGLQNAVFQDPQLYRTRVDGTLTITGPLAGGGRVGGELFLEETEIRVPSSSIGTLGDLPDVVHIGESAAVRETLRRAHVSAGGGTAGGGGGGAAPLVLDIEVDAPARIFVRGRGLDAELGGSLRLTGTTRDVVPIGRFELLRGRLDILQQRFELTEGIATLQGEFLPYIRLVAETESQSGTTIQIIVEGPANAPEVSFVSVPELPQDEVLAQLLFGRSIDSISPLQALQLASALSTLAGRGGDTIDDLRSGLGLADFDLTTTEDGTFAVRAGAYLSENLYTDVTITAEGETEINLNLDLTENLTAKGTVDADGETSLGIFYERDY